MKVLVLNGSPKGQTSVTLQSVKYLQKFFEDDVFEVLDVGQQIKAFEREDKFNLYTNGILSADLVLICYPVYTFLATAQLHRFFEIMQKFGAGFGGKYVTQFTTSKHFYDVTAHGTVKAIVGDLNGYYVDGLSADMEDLTVESGRRELVKWWNYVRFQVERGIAVAPKNELKILPPAYEKGGTTAVCKKTGKRVVVVTDSEGEEGLENMISDFIAACSYPVEIVNLHDFAFKCGCLGCLKCAADGVCAVGDGFEKFLSEKINGADAFLMAFTVTGHALSSLFKTFYDRQFVNGHRPVTAGKPTGYIVRGSLVGETVLQTYIDAKSSVGGNYNCGVACDDGDTAKAIENLAARLDYALENRLTPAKDFYEIGGMRIFRDMIWIMRGLMQADYKFYKKNDMLDFPQKQRGKMLAMCLVGKMLKNKALTKKMPNMLSDGMMMPYNKALASVPEDKKKF